MTGTHILPPIAPWCGPVCTPVEVIAWKGDRVLLRDLQMAARGREYYIESDLEDFIPDIPQQ